MPIPDLDALERYEPTLTYIGTGEYGASMEPEPDGDWVRAPDLIAHVRALREALHEACVNWSRTMESLDRENADLDGVMRRTYDRQCAEAESELHRLRTLAGPRKEGT